MTRPLEWIAAVRDHPDRPPAVQRHVLCCLALRLDWSTGTGYASTGTLMADASCRDRTVRNATTWARRADLLKMTRKGHRLGDGRVIGSEWLLRLPVDNQVSTGTGMPVENLNRHAGTSQPARGDAPSRPSLSRPSSAPADLRAQLTTALPGLDDRKIGKIAEGLEADPAIPKPSRWLATVAANGHAVKATAKYITADQPPKLATLCTRCGQRGHTAAECTA